MESNPSARADSAQPPPLPDSLSPVEQAVAQLALVHGKRVEDVAAQAGVRVERIAAIADVVLVQLQLQRAAARDRRVRRSAHAGLLAAAGAVALLAAAGIEGPVRAVLALAAVALVPGAAILTRLHVHETLTWLGLCVCLSLAVATAAALAMAWTGLWHPDAVAVVVGGASAALLALDVRKTTLR